MKKTITFILILAGYMLCAQNAAESGKKVKNNQPATEYDRLSLTYLLLDPGTGNYLSILKKDFGSLQLPGKFDDNSISGKFIPSPVTPTETANAFLFNPRTPNEVVNKINKSLVDGHYANAVIAKWFSRKEDGSFGLELLQQRGLYNANDADVKEANASKLGNSKLMDAGEHLLNKSYILVYDIRDLISKSEEYDRQQKNSKTVIKRNQNGFVANLDVYVFRISFNDTINAIFWQQLWAVAGSPDLAARKQAFDRYNFPLTYVTRVSNRVEASQYNKGEALAPKVQASSEELILKLLNDGMNQSIFAIERSLEEFRVKTALFGTHPLTAKIGLKENLKLDQRFFVFEMRQGGNGEIKAHRQGVIRASKHIVDNRQVSSGNTEPSRFYQVGGKRLDEGMLLQQRNDAGLAFTLGGSTGGISGVNGKLEFNISTLLKKNAPSMLKLYFEGGYDPVKVDLYVNGTDAGSVSYSNFIRYGGGLGKEFCFLRNFRFQPFAGIGLESVSQKDDSQKTLSSLYGRFGGTLGINLKPGIQLVGTYGSYTMFGSITDQDKNTIKPTGPEGWADGKWGHSGTTMDFGIRFEF